MAAISSSMMMALLLVPFDEGSARVVALVLFLLLTISLWILLRRRATLRRIPLRPTTGLGPLILVSTVIAFLVWLNRPHEPFPSNNASAVGSLRTINTAASIYASTYKNGYPPTLASLAPAAGGSGQSCNSAGLIDDVLAAGRKTGYVFDYKPGEPVKTTAQDCIPGVQGYTITARPLKYGQTGSVNYFTDSSGKIHQASEDRPANKNDPVLAG